jgi:hypothetical protein
MGEAPENGKESSHSAHPNGIEFNNNHFHTNNNNNNNNIIINI